MSESKKGAAPKKPTPKSPAPKKRGGTGTPPATPPPAKKRRGQKDREPDVEGDLTENADQCTDLPGMSGPDRCR